jgi:hypothetical protein
MNAQSNPGPVDFDLSRGRVERRASAEGKDGQDDQVVLIPLAALAGLEKSAGWEVLKQLVRSIGVSIGRRAGARLGAARGVASASLEAVVSTLASEVAVSGWGALRLERWGRAMVLVIDHAPALPAGALAALIEGAIEAAAAREVHGVSLSPERATASSARVLIASEKTAERARRWLIEGASESDVLGRLSSANGGAS